MRDYLRFSCRYDAFIAIVIPRDGTDRRTANEYGGTYTLTMEMIMFKTLNAANETVVPLTSDEIAAVAGGAIYIDGRYAGEGGLSMHPWPGGVPVWNVWPDGSRTPH